MIDKLQALPAAFQASMMRGGLPKILTPLLLSVLTCPSYVVRPSTALPHPSLCKPCHGREGEFKGSRRGLGFHRLLLATIGATSGQRDGQDDRHTDAICRTSNHRMAYSRNHAMCGDSGACKQWEGLSCAEVDNLIHNVQKYERVYSDSNLRAQMQPDSRSGKMPFTLSNLLCQERRHSFCTVASVAYVLSPVSSILFLYINTQQHP
jgi:hypothetical protein